MEEKTKIKLAAGGIVAVGVARMVGGVMMATGHGFFGAMFKKHHMMGNALRLGTMSVKAGKEMIQDGISEWKRA